MERIREGNEGPQATFCNLIVPLQRETREQNALGIPFAHSMLED